MTQIRYYETSTWPRNILLLWKSREWEYKTFPSVRSFMDRQFKLHNYGHLSHWSFEKPNKETRFFKTASFRGGSPFHSSFLPPRSEAFQRVKMAVAGLYKRSLPSPPAIDFSSTQGRVTFSPLPSAYIC